MREAAGSSAPALRPAPTTLGRERPQPADLARAWWRRAVQQNARMVPPRGDVVPLADRFRITQVLRGATVLVVLAGVVALPGTLTGGTGAVLAGTAAFAVLTVLGDLVVRLLPHRTEQAFGTLFALDAGYLSWASAHSGLANSPLQLLVLLHVGAVALLTSARTSALLAAEYTALLLVARMAGGVPGPGADERLLELLVVVWLAAVSTTLLSALNERELRRRRGDLEALTALAERIERTDDSGSVAHALLDATAEPLGFPRAVLLGGPEGGLAVLGAVGPVSTGGRPGVSPAVQHAQAQQSSVLLRALDPEHEPWLSRLLPGAGSVVVVPLATEGRPVGALVLERPVGVRLDRRALPALERTASYAALALRNAWLLEQVQRMAATDGLTKIANRRTFEATLERELARAARGHEPVSLVLLDIDHFKALNDRHGHPAGDEVLRNVAAALVCECRDFDTPARYGGEEFVVVLPGCGPDEARDIAERLRASVARAPGATSVTASAGVATYPVHAGDGAGLVRAADQALYASKHAGRDRTTVSTGLPEEDDVDALLRRALTLRLGRAAVTVTADASGAAGT